MLYKNIKLYGVNRTLKKAVLKKDNMKEMKRIEIR